MKSSARTWVWRLVDSQMASDVHRQPLSDDQLWLDAFLSFQRSNGIQQRFVEGGPKDCTTLAECVQLRIFF